MTVKTFPLLGLLALAIPTPAQTPKPAPAPSGYASQVAPVLAKYCVGCHNPGKVKGNFNLGAFPDEASVVRDLKTWQKVLDSVEGENMPPEGQPQPSASERTGVVHYLQSTLSKTNCSIAQDPGRVTLRRLNREEYNNTVRDLVGVDFRPADDFPSDDVGYGFDNIGDVLTLAVDPDGKISLGGRGHRQRRRSSSTTTRPGRSTKNVKLDDNSWPRPRPANTHFESGFWLIARQRRHQGVDV